MFLHFFSHYAVSPTYDTNTYTVPAITQGHLSSCSTEEYATNLTCSFPQTNETNLFGDNLPTSSSDNQQVMDIRQV